jgi:hypothetical protein
VQEDVHVAESGKTRLIAGRTTIRSDVTYESALLVYAVLHFGDHNVNGGVRRFRGPEEYQALLKELTAAFERSDYAELIRAMDRDFGSSTYSLRSLFRDDQRRVVKRLLQPALADAGAVYRRLYEQHVSTMRFLVHLGLPLPRAFRNVAEFLLNDDLAQALDQPEPPLDQIRNILADAVVWHITLDLPAFRYKFTKTIGRLAEDFSSTPDNVDLLRKLDAAVSLVRSLPYDVDLSKAQNIYFSLLQTVTAPFEQRANDGDPQARTWLHHFLELGDKLNVQSDAVKKK